jgi:hypothetical protein
MRTREEREELEAQRGEAKTALREKRKAEALARRKTEYAENK